jgi:predicted CXXCH cytochrome family protein
MTVTATRLRLTRVHVLIALVLVGLWLIASPSHTNAQSPDNTSCLACHSKSGQTATLSGGEVLPVSVDPAVYGASIHGQKGVQCVSCHPNITGFPHPKVTAADRRGYQLEMYTVCKSCHQDQFQQTLDSNHARALLAGNTNAAVCTDCHGAHDVSDPKQPRAKMSQVCANCHSAIYGQYAKSVHGTALTENSNPDVAVCTDCHGVHQQADPTTAAFRLNSPEVCGGCHANQTLMRKYNISTDVFNTYVSDFHGTTVMLFDKQSPNQPSNKAVCTDCHGVHDIKPVNDQTATVVKQNLLKTCQKCHPDASANFPDSWVGHFPPSPTVYPLVYYVGLFYKVIIPAVIGGMLLFVLLDGFRRILDRVQRKGA